MGKIILGGLMILGGLVLGLYVSIVVCLVGGMWDLIHFAQSGYVTYDLLVWGVVKLFCMTIAGSLSAYALIIPGMGVIATAE